MKTFNQNFEVRIADNTMNALNQAHNVDFYDCPLVRAHVEKIDKQIRVNTHTRSEVYGNVFASQLNSIFRHYCANNDWVVSSKLTYSKAKNAYSFDVYSKISSGYFIDSLGHKLPTFVKIIITVTISLVGKTFKIVTHDHYETDKKSSEYNAPLTDIKIISVPRKTLIFEETKPMSYDIFIREMVQKNFVFNGSVIKLAANYYEKLINSFSAAIQEVQANLASCKICNGNFLNSLHFCYSRTYYNANSYQIISAVWRKSIVVYPMFNKLSAEKQFELLEKAFKDVKQEIGSKQVNASAYAQALYYQIVDNNLDTILAVPREGGARPFPPKKKVRARWGREDRINAIPTLLASPKEFEEFNHSELAPSELVWVQYGSLEDPITYLASDIWPMMAESFTPNSPFNIVATNQDENIENENEEDFDE